MWLPTVPTVARWKEAEKSLEQLEPPAGHWGYRGSGPLQLGPIMHRGALVLDDAPIF